MCVHCAQNHTVYDLKKYIFVCCAKLILTPIFKELTEDPRKENISKINFLRKY